MWCLHDEIVSQTICKIVLKTICWGVQTFKSSCRPSVKLSQRQSAVRLHGEIVSKTLVRIGLKTSLKTVEIRYRHVIQRHAPPPSAGVPCHVVSCLFIFNAKKWTTTKIATTFCCLPPH